jgi:hypothetical protein
MKEKTCKLCKSKFIKTLKIQNKCEKCLLKISAEQIKKSIQRYIEKLKTTPKSEKIIKQEKVNKLVRKRDFGKPCISCGEFKKLFAGHYISVAKSKALRYNLENIHGQCFECNNLKSGNLKNYRIGLIERFGIEFVEKLENYKL